MKHEAKLAMVVIVRMKYTNCVNAENNEGVRNVLNVYNKLNVN